MYNRREYTDLFFAVVEMIFSSRERRKFLRLVPEYCKSCDALGVCRDKDNDWKCRHGCLIMRKK